MTYSRISALARLAVLARGVFLAAIFAGLAAGPAVAQSSIRILVNDEPVRPQLLEQLLPGDGPVAMLHKIQQHFQHLGFELNRLPHTAEFKEIRVEFVVIKGIEHHLAPLLQVT